jgi:aldose 1-epimerase
MPTDERDEVPSAATAAVPPSGHQLELAWEDQRAVVTEVGGGLRSYTVGGRPVLDGYGAGEMCSGGRGQVLVPWPNRLAEGRYDFGGAQLQLPLSEPKRGNASHGLVRWEAWQVIETQSDRAVVGHVVHPRPGYPFRLALTVAYRLSPAGLAVTTTATNTGTEALPYGAGFHPYLTVGTDLIDEAKLQVPSPTRLEVDDRGIPTGRELAVEGSAHDFRSARLVRTMQLDDCYTDLERDASGYAYVTLAAPDRRSAVTVWMDRSLPFVMIFTGDTLGADRRRRGLAVEPMSCAPDAFRNGRGLKVLRPGETTVARWGIQHLPRG